MADERQLEILRQGASAWNDWRAANNTKEVQLSGANLSGADLSGAILSRADLSGTHLVGANLIEADLSGANLSGAGLIKAALMGADFNQTDLSRADLWRADLSWANLSGANLSGANLREANLSQANLSGADLSRANLMQAILREARLINAALIAASLGQANLSQANLGGADLSLAVLEQTVLGRTNLTDAKGLDTIQHIGPSIIDHRTLEKSGPMPLGFLRGCGLPDPFIDYLPSLLNRPIELCSCFISYSSKNEEFATRLHSDLQENGVRCWFADHDVPIGGKILEPIDTRVRVHEKLLLILSHESISSDWLEDEVEAGFSKERKRSTTVLFPVRIDEAVMESERPWAAKLQDTRHIGNFTHWKNHDAYQVAFERLLRDLKKSHPTSPESAVE